MNDLFHRFANWVSSIVGSPWAFCAAVATVILWAVLGPRFHYSDTWQLVINTGTTIITFLIVFLIQHTQNRDAKAFHLKLDELLKGTKGARTRLVDLEGMSDEELDKLQKEFENLRKSLSNKEKEVSDEQAERHQTNKRANPKREKQNSK
jgi:low affinity Fe/Cu permease